MDGGSAAWIGTRLVEERCKSLWQLVVLLTRCHGHSLYCLCFYFPALLFIESLCAELQVNSVFSSSEINTPTHFLLFVCSNVPLEA